MARSTYIYSVMKKTKPGENIREWALVIACTVKWEMLDRVRQALDNGNLVAGEFEIFRTPDNGLFGNGAIITDQFVFGAN